MSDSEDEFRRRRNDDDDEDEERRRRDEERRKEEAQAELQKKQEERRRQEQAEAAKKHRPTGKKRKGLGGLSPEKKKKLKQIIMQKAAEEMRAEAKKKQEAKENHLKSVVGPLGTEGLDQSSLERRVKELHQRVNNLEAEKYDWEQKCLRQDIEINELTGKINDTKGKFTKPVLKKVSKTESTLARYSKKGEKSSGNFREGLKATGQNKFALDEVKDDGHKVDFRENLKAANDADQGEGGDNSAGATITLEA